jgi:hypothetical protein
MVNKYYKYIITFLWCYISCEENVREAAYSNKHFTAIHFAELYRRYKAWYV